MGSTNKYDAQRVNYVKTKMEDPNLGAGGQIVSYAFSTNIEQSVENDLGHTNLPPANYADPPAGLVWKANYPTPTRASKRFATQIASSFCSADKVGILRRRGWNITEADKTSPAIIAGQVGSLVQAVFVSIPTKNINYGWNIPVESYTRIAALTGFAALNIEQMTNADKNRVVFGIRGTGSKSKMGYPVPPRFKATIITGLGTQQENSTTHTSFYQPGANLTDPIVPYKPAILEILKSSIG